MCTTISNKRHFGLSKQKLPVSRRGVFKTLAGLEDESGEDEND